MEKERLIKSIIECQRKIDRGRRQYELEVWMSLPLSIAQLKCLFFISNQGGTNLGSLATALGVTPTNVTGIVERLVQKGLISRTENLEDRRMLSLRTTEQGNELISKLRQRRISYMTELLTKMSLEELAVLARGLASLSREVDTEEKENKERLAV
jgi:DNA-binding MarR family transcriptional regulator